MTTTAAFEAPYAHRKVLIAPNFFIKLGNVGHPLANYKPRTKLGRVALDLTMLTSTSLISVSALSAYVYSLTQLALPVLTFQESPPGTTIPPESLQTAYQDFNTQVALFQGQASLWMDTQPGTSTPSILTQLVAIPRTFGNINGSVQSQFIILESEIPGSQAYINTLNQLKNLIGAELPDITNLNKAMTTLGTNLLNATNTIDTAATTGVLAQLIQAYQSEMTALQQQIDNANSTISSDNAKIVGLGVAAGASITVGIIGLVNFWNPFGWIMIGVGAVGAYYSITEIMALKAQIASLQLEIQKDEAWKTTDSQAAASIQSTITQTKGFAAMNAAAQEELTELENLLTTLGNDIHIALNDLDQGEIQDALNEWNEIVSAASVLANVTAYVWPSPILLPSPSTFSAAGVDVYAVSVSGQAYHYSSGGTSWAAVADKSLSIVAVGSLVVGINGAPVDGAEVSPTPYPANYYVKKYDVGSGTWSTISTFPAAAIATDGTSIYAINQTQSDRQAYKYNGSGTNWSALAAMPNSDAPIQIAVAGGKLFAITTNSMQAYVYNGSSWSSLNANTYTTISSNGTKVGLVTTDNYSYLYDASSGSFGNGGSSTGSSVMQIAQVSNGDQYVINTEQILYFINNQVSPSAATELKQHVIGISVSDTDVVYCNDNEGNSYKLDDLGSNRWTQLPTLPSFSS